MAISKKKIFEPNFIRFYRDRNQISGRKTKLKSAKIAKYGEFNPKTPKKGRFRQKCRILPFSREPPRKRILFMK
jgi:hypothetical protein